MNDDVRIGRAGGGYDANAPSTLLTNYRLLHHVREGKGAAPQPILTEGRNFALAALSFIASDMTYLRDSFSKAVDERTGQVPLTSWRRILSETVRRRRTPDEDETPLQSELRNLAFDESQEGQRKFDDLMKRLVAMFDVTDCGRASWANFSDFMTECAVKGPVLPDPEDINQYAILDRIERQPRVIKDLQWCEGRGCVAVLSYDPPRTTKAIPDSNIELYANPEDDPDWRKAAPVVHSFGTSIVSFTTLPHLDHKFLMSSADMQLRLTDMVGRRPRTTYQGEIGESFARMRWSERWNRLWCGCSDGLITVLSVPNDPSFITPIKTVATDRTHTSALTHLEVLSTDGSVLSASMDPRLIIQEPTKHTVVADFVGHRGAINATAHCPEYNLLVSGGFDNDLFLWTMQGQRRGAREHCSVRPLTALTDEELPHKPPIVMVATVPGTPQILSLDVTGLLKVWDLRTYGCAQSRHVDPRYLQSPTRDGGFSGGVYIPSRKAMVTYTSQHVRPVVYTNKGSAYNKATADEVIVAMQYSAAADNLVTATQTAVQSWELRTGVKSSEVSVGAEVHGEVTAFGIDAMGRKVIVGHRGGLVSFFNTSNGRCAGRRQLGEFDIVDVCGYGSDGIGFAVDDSGAVYICSDDGDTMPTYRLERVSSAKFVRASSAAKMALVFHGSLGVHVYSMRAARYSCPMLTQFIDLSGNIAQSGPDVSSALAKVTDGECCGARIVMDADDTGTVAFAAADGYNTITLWAAGRVGQTAASDFSCVGRWQCDYDVSTIAIERRNDILYVVEVSGTVRLYDLRPAVSEVTAHIHAQHAATLSGSMRAGEAFSVTGLAQLGAAFKPPRGRPLALLAHPDVGMLLSMPGDRSLCVLPLYGQSESLGDLSLDRSVIDFGEAKNAEALRDAQQLVLQRLRSACRVDDESTLQLSDDHPATLLRSDSLASSPSFVRAIVRQQRRATMMLLEEEHGAALVDSSPPRSFVSPPTMRRSSHATPDKQRDDGAPASPLWTGKRCPTPFRYTHSVRLHAVETSTTTTTLKSASVPDATMLVEPDVDHRNDVLFRPAEVVTFTARERRERQRRRTEATLGALDEQAEAVPDVSALKRSIDVAMSQRAATPAIHEFRTTYAPSPVEAPEVRQATSSTPPPVRAFTTMLVDPRDIASRQASRGTAVAARSLRREAESQREAGTRGELADLISSVSLPVGATPNSSSRSVSLPARYVPPATPALPSIVPRSRRRAVLPAPRGVLARALEENVCGIFFN
jgi:WD40 repeat protein